MQMKLPLIIACLFITALCSAQEGRSTSRHISDDGNTLRLKYQVTGSKSIDYSNEFEVKGWSKEQKHQLVSRIIDSLESNPGKAPERDYVNKRIDDDGIKMKVAIEGKRNGNVVSFNKSFDVKGLNQEQKNALVDELVKSLGLSPKQ